MIYTKKNQHGLALSELERGDDAGGKKKRYKCTCDLGLRLRAGKKKVGRMCVYI